MTDELRDMARELLTRLNPIDGYSDMNRIVRGFAMENSMIDIVAKAIEAEKQRGGMAGSWTNADENLRLAEAAIRAMRAPTDEMWEAARRIGCFDLIAYEAVIDAALSSPPSKS